MPYGHVAVIVQVLPKSIRIAEQNFYFHYWPRHFARQIPLVYENGSYFIKDHYQVYGWMEIDDNKKLQPLDPSTQGKVQMRNEKIFDSACSFVNTNLSVYYCILFIVLLISHVIFP